MISFIKNFVLDILSFDSMDSQFSDKRKLLVKDNSMCSFNNTFISHLNQDEITINFLNICIAQLLETPNIIFCSLYRLISLKLRIRICFEYIRKGPKFISNNYYKRSQNQQLLDCVFIIFTVIFI